MPPIGSQISLAHKFKRRIHVRRQQGAALSPRLLDQLRQSIKLPGADDEVDPGDSLRQLILLVLSHTSCQTDDQFRLLLLSLLETCHTHDGTLLGVFPNRAGVVKDHSGVIRIMDQEVALSLESLEHQLGIEFVHLAAEHLEVDTMRPGYTGGDGSGLHRIGQFQ